MSNQEKAQRLIEAATCLLSEAPDRRMNIVVLNKALFYLDLAALRDFGETVTHNSFIALEQGPVVAQYKKRLIRPLEEANVAFQEEDGLSKPVVLRDGFQSEPQYMDPDVRRLARTIASWMSDRTSSDVSDYSHENLGWQLAYQEGMGKGAKAQSIDPLIAMQQIVERDPWLDEPLTSHAS